jgi:cation:H+ antiporter
VTLGILLMVGGFVLLAFSADRFVLAAARLAKLWGMSTLLIGAIVVGMGTSLPELLVSVSGGLDSFDLGIGNITGSNVANLSLVLGTAVIISPIFGSAKVLKDEGSVTLVAMGIFTIVLRDGGLDRFDGVVLLITMAWAMWQLLHLESSKPEAELFSEVGEGIQDDVSAPKELAFAAVTLVAMLFGADFLTDGALIIADEAGLSEGFVGRTLVAVGTSLPELAAAVAAARQREHELILGNLLGSNIFNSALVAGTLALVSPGVLTEPVVPALGFMMGIVVLAGIFAVTRSISRLEGLGLLVAYGAFVWLA